MGSANNATALGKELWPQKSIDLNMLEGSPLIGLAKHDEDFGEDIRHIYVNYSASQGLAAGFSEAKESKSAAGKVRFDLSTRSYYGNFSVDGAVWRRYKYTGNKGLVMDEVARNSETLMAQAKNDLSTYLHGDGVGVLGRMTAASTPLTSATVTLRLTADGRRIEPGMWLQTEATGATGGTINPGYVIVTSVQEASADTWTVTVSGTDWDTGIPLVAVSDYIYRYGTYDAVPHGLSGWLPYWLGSTPGTFLGANRNLSYRKLAGDVLDGTVLDPMTRMIRASRKVRDNGFKPDTYFMSTRNWEMLYTQLASASRLKQTKVAPEKIRGFSFGVEYDAIEFVGPGGLVQVFADPWMPDNVERCGQRNTLMLGSVGPLMHWDDGSSPNDGRVEDAQDARECRLVGDISFYVTNPGAWCTVSVTP